MIFKMASSISMGMLRDIMANMEIAERVVLTSSKRPPRTHG
jgi:hypothetical protein